MTDREARGGTLVIGGGFAGGYVARCLRKRGATIVSPENFMLYTPMLPEAASGTLEPRHTVVPLRMMCPHAEFVLGRATSVDFKRSRVQVETIEGHVDLSYRDLVIALGAISRTLPIPGLADHALGFKSLADAIHLRNHVLRRLEAADAAPDETQRLRELTFVFVGAGYAGVEALAELSDLVRDALRYYPNLQTVPQRWVLVDAAAKILPEIPRRLGEYAAEKLTRRGVEIRVETTLESVEANAAQLSDGERILTHTLVWTAGVRAHPAALPVRPPARRARPRDRRARRCRSKATSTSGRSETARACRTSPRPARSTRPRASTRCARPGGWRRTSRESGSRTATACSARWRRSAATRGSPTCWACG